MAAENRFTVRELAGIAAARKLKHAGAFLFNVEAIAIGKASDPAWVASISMSDAVVPTTLVDFQVADDSGKVKRFQTLDSLVKTVSGINEDNGGVYRVDSVDTGELFASKVPANIYTDAENKVVKLTKVKASQVAKHGALAALTANGGAMYGWNNGNAAQVVRYDETVAQAESVNRDVAALTAEIARLQAIVDSNPNP